jgi:hypothetical protein
LRTRPERREGGVGFRFRGRFDRRRPGGADHVTDGPEEGMRIDRSFVTCVATLLLLVVRVPSSSAGPQPDLRVLRLVNGGHRVSAGGRERAFPRQNVGRSSALPGRHHTESGAAPPVSQSASTPDGSGGIIAIWEDSRAGPDLNLYAQRVDGSGAPQWNAGGVAICTAALDQFAPQIIGDGAGGEQEGRSLTRRAAVIR